MEEKAEGEGRGNVKRGGEKWSETESNPEVTGREEREEEEEEESIVSVSSGKYEVERTDGWRRYRRRGCSRCLRGGIHLKARFLTLKIHPWPRQQQEHSHVNGGNTRAERTTPRVH